MEEEDERREARAEKFRSKFEALFRRALAPPEATPNSKQHKQTTVDISPQGHPLYVQSKAIIKGIENIQKEYERLVEYISNIEKPPDLRDAWERDYEEVRRLATLGREACEAEIKELLRDKGRPESHRAKARRKRQQKKFQEDSHLQEMLKMGLEALGEKDRKQGANGWGAAAHKVQRALDAMIKALPDRDVESTE
ncbi:hypothetical protein VTO42DRAFT_2947 [Malbranchea cinnamomea]